MFKLLICVLIVNGVIGQQQSEDELDKIIGDIFNSTTPTPRKCVCVPYYMCDPETKTVVDEGSEDGYLVIDIRFGENKCEHYLDVCCDPGKELPTTHKPLTTTTTETPIVPVKIECGVRNARGVGFQITGNVDEAQFGEFPWMVAILKTHWRPNSGEELAQCGGALIHPQVVLTAAHCTQDHIAQDLKVRAGEWDTQTTKEELPYQERDVTEIIKHPDFSDKTLANDLALLILASPVELDRHIGTICLPEQEQVFDQRDCYASGWGKKEFGKEGKYQVILKKIELPMVDKAKCQEDLRKTRLKQKFKLHPSFVCAGGEAGKDTCRGDGGSPLVCPAPSTGRYQQAGIVAWGIGCGEQDVPGVYADVSAFRNWIDSQMIRLGYGTSSYLQQ